MNVTFYNFSKRRNSTKQPSGGTTYTCLLKDDTSTSRPSIEIKWNGTSSAPASNNYCYIADFGRYYWVDSWTYSDRKWIANCTVDVLATYKTQIGSSSKYVTRSASESDDDIIDTLYPAKATFRTASTVINSPYGQNMSNGRYILSISSGGTTGVQYIQLDVTNFQALLAFCYQETATIWSQSMATGDVGTALQKYGEAMQKSTLNPFQYINSVLWVPDAFSGLAQSNLELGPMVATGVSYVIPSSPIHEINETITVPTISATYEWEKVAPYREYMLRIPPFGEVTLDATLMRDISTVHVDTIYDYVAGAATARVYGTTSSSQVVMLTTVSGQIGIPVAAASNMVDNIGALSAKVGAVSSIAGGVASVISGNIGGAISAVSGAASSVISGYAAAAPRPQQCGVAGGVGYLRQNHSLHVLQYDRPDTDDADFGKPLYKVKTISSLSGYVQLAEGEVSCNATESEHRELEAFLTGGFFYE